MLKNHSKAQYINWRIFSIQVYHKTEEFRFVDTEINLPNYVHSVSATPDKVQRMSRRVVAIIRVSGIAALRLAHAQTAPKFCIQAGKYLQPFCSSTDTPVQVGDNLHAYVVAKPGVGKTTMLKHALANRGGMAEVLALLGVNQEWFKAFDEENLTRLVEGYPGFFKLNGRRILGYNIDYNV